MSTVLGPPDESEAPAPSRKVSGGRGSFCSGSTRHPSTTSGTRLSQCCSGSFKARTIWPSNGVRVLSQNKQQSFAHYAVFDVVCTPGIGLRVFPTGGRSRRFERHLWG